MHVQSVSQSVKWKLSKNKLSTHFHRRPLNRMFVLSDTKQMETSDWLLCRGRHWIGSQVSVDENCRNLPCQQFSQICKLFMTFPSCCFVFYFHKIFSFLIVPVFTNFPLFTRYSTLNYFVFLCFSLYFLSQSFWFSSYSFQFDLRERRISKASCCLSFLTFLLFYTLNFLDCFSYFDSNLTPDENQRNASLLTKPPKEKLPIG